MIRNEPGVGRTPFSIPPVPSIQGTQRTVQSVRARMPSPFTRSSSRALRFTLLQDSFL